MSEKFPQEGVEALEHVFDEGLMLSNGYTVEYEGYELRKADVTLSPEHTGFGLYNRTGNKVESFTVGAFDTFEEFKNSVDRVVEYDPDDLSEWLNRD